MNWTLFWLHVWLVWGSPSSCCAFLGTSPPYGPWWKVSLDMSKKPTLVSWIYLPPTLTQELLAKDEERTDNVFCGSSCGSYIQFLRTARVRRQPGL